MALGNNIMEAISYRAKWFGTFFAGKLPIEATHVIGHEATHMIGHGAATGAVSATTSSAMTAGAGGAAAHGAAAGFSAGIFGLVVMPLVLGVSAVLAQIDHRHRRNELTEDFREELAASTGKKPEEVTHKDLDVIANGDASKGRMGIDGLRTALAHSARERNNMIILSVISSVVTLTAMTALGPLLGPILSEVGVVGEIAAKAVVGLATYLTVKQPLHMLASWADGISELSVAERAASMGHEREAGHHIGKSKIFSIYVQANPELSQMIRRDFGRRFDGLKASKQGAAMERYGALVGLDEMDEKINKGIVKPQEILFDAYGQQSGVAPKEPLAEAHHSTIARVWNSCCAGVKSLVHRKPHDKPQEAAQETPSTHKPTATPRDEHMKPQQVDPFDFADHPAHQARGSHVERHASKRGEPDMSHVDKLVQEQVAATLQPQPIR